MYGVYFFVFKHKTAYEMRISDWSSDVCSSDLSAAFLDVLASPTLGSRYSVARPVRPFSQEIGTDPGRLRFGLLRASRSDERRVGKECVSTCRSRWSPFP